MISEIRPEWEDNGCTRRHTNEAIGFLALSLKKIYIIIGKNSLDWPVSNKKADRKHGVVVVVGGCLTCNKALQLELNQGLYESVATL